MSGIEKTQSVCLVILTVIAVGASLVYLQTVLLPFVIALFVVIGCRPISEYFQRRLKLHHLLAFGLTFFLGLLLLAIWGFLTWASIQDLAQNRADYEKRLASIAVWIEDNLHREPEENGEPEENVETSENGETIDQAESKEPTENPEQMNDSEPYSNQAITNRETSKKEESRRSVRKLLRQGAEFLEGLLLDLAGSLSTLLSYGVLILIFVFFLLLGDESIDDRPQLLTQIESKVRQYLVVKTVISALTGFAFGLVLWLFGVPLAIVFGFLAFLLNYIPNLGPLISTLTPVPFLVLNSEMSIGGAIVCFALIGAIQFISGNVIETRIMGKSFDVSPIFLLLALMFFGQIWGIVGMFLATPIVSIIKIVLEQNENTKWMGDLMAGRLSKVMNGSPA